MGKRELVALLNLSCWCLVMVERFFLAVSWGFLQFVIVVFPDNNHLLFFYLQFGREFISFLGRANVRAFHENPNRSHTDLTFIDP